ncbi:hypothetical protein [Paraclostridium sordellii]|uniref:hypothetical protein n=1 Tax=Paraclostridium sordellii TaxID=1505 RepID=UPI0005E3158B|nr:hypothetical protein [Paeniclostridium sordellii]CEQ26750.1 Uncharacterised protein [[Clostridium] sordellii] [Paeniclostridium sordellii]
MKTYIDYYNRNRGKYSKVEKYKLINLTQHKIDKQKSKIADLSSYKNKLDASLAIVSVSLIASIGVELKDETHSQIIWLVLFSIIGALLIGYLFSKEIKKDKQNELYIEDLRKAVNKLELQKIVYKNLLLDEDGVTP